MAREVLPDIIKRAIITKRAPPALLVHFLANMQALGAQVRSAIEAYVVIAGRRWSHDGGSVGSFHKGSGKHKGKDQNGRMARTRPRGKGKQYQDRLECYCGKWVRWGHRQRDCGGHIHVLEEVASSAGGSPTTATSPARHSQLQGRP